MPRQLSVLSCWDAFVCRTCLDHNCSVQEKLEFERGEDVLEKMEKLCYLVDIIICYGKASEAASARIGSVWKKFKELSGMLVGKQGLSLKQQGKIYQCCVRPVLLHCCEIWPLSVADEAKLCGMERHMVMMMCGMRLVDWVSTYVLRGRMGVNVKIEDMIIQSHLWCYGHVMRGYINYQIREVMEVEPTGKKKKGRPSKSWEDCIRKDFE